MESLFRIQELEEELRLLESQNHLLEEENKNLKAQQASQQLNSDALFKDLFLNTRQACIVFTPIEDGKDFIISNVNPAFERIEGVKKELVLGVKLSDVYQYASANIMDVYRRVFKSGESEKFVFSWEDKDKKKQWRDNDIFKLSSGEVVAFYENTTSLKEKECALLNSEERFKALSNASNEAVFFTVDEHCVEV